MVPKRPRDGGDTTPTAKKPRRAFKAAPENLPDGPWRRKLLKTKQDLIHKAKVKKAYAKIKAEEQVKCTAQPQPPKETANGESSDEQSDDDEQLHPTRQLMLKDEEAAQTGATGRKADGEEAVVDADGKAVASDGQLRRTRRPGYYDKQLQNAATRREEVEQRVRERAERQEQKERRLAERERFKRAMAKTRDRDGKKKLGRESGLLLDKVRRLVGEK